MKTFKPDIKNISNFCLLLEEKIDGYVYKLNNGLIVIISGAIEDDGKKWIHVSFSRKSRMPEYKDMKLVKNIFLENKKAIMVFPEKIYHVNIHPYCLHLWHCIDADLLPEFSKYRSI